MSNLTDISKKLLKIKSDCVNINHLQNQLIELEKKIEEIKSSDKTKVKSHKWNFPPA